MQAAALIFPVYLLPLAREEARRVQGKADGIVGQRDFGLAGSNRATLNKLHAQLQRNLLLLNPHMEVENSAYRDFRLGDTPQPNQY